MSKYQSKSLFYIAFLLIFIVVMFFVLRKTEAPTGNDVTQETSNPTEILTKIGNDEIIIDFPAKGQIISSGVLEVKGQARGSWYFEANAPFEIQDYNHNKIAQSYVTAQGEWMTTEFVPFTGKINFVVPEGITEGFVVFRNDNPSGEPQFDRKLEVPVKFKN